MYDNFFINLAVHTSLLKNSRFKKAKILIIKIYTPLAVLKYYSSRGERWFYYNIVISQGVYCAKLAVKSGFLRGLELQRTPYFYKKQLWRLFKKLLI